jgi:methylation protein EvaC
MKILIFGSDGMLGKYATLYLSRFYTVIPLTRNDFDIEQNLSTESVLSRFGMYSGDVVLNCTGIIPQKVDSVDFKKYMTVNTLFPIHLSTLCQSLDVKLIHITTDCVFSGKDGEYNEYSKHDDTSIYGVSKSLGEHAGACIIRTSIIGEDLHSKSLLGWVKSQDKKCISGYSSHFWNGITCHQLAKIISIIIEKNLYWKGVVHIFSPESFSKYELIKQIISVYELDIELIEKQITYSNRTLTSLYDINEFSIPSLYIQLQNMKKFDDSHRIKLGEYKQLDRCRFCDTQLKEVFNLGDRFSLAGSFIRDLEKECRYEKTYPLSISMCTGCTLIQCTQVVNADILFKQGYFYYSSMIPMLVSHFQSFADKLAGVYKPLGNNVTVLEMGCNDGVLLRPMVKHGFNVIGVDPSCTVNALIEEGYDIYNTYLDDDVCNKILEKHGLVDLFLSSNSFAHIDDMKNIMKCMKSILTVGGCAIIEVHYLKAIIDDLNFDFIYHEHMSYYSISSLHFISKLFGMTIVDVEFTKIHGSSIRVYLKNSVEETPDKINILLEGETYLKDVNTFMNYSSTLHSWRNEFRTFYDSLIADGKKIYGYGSSGRANTFCSYCDLRLDYIIDDAPSKIGNYTPIYHSNIVSSDILRDSPPDYVLILAWSYTDDIIKKNKNYHDNGGKFIIPLPMLYVV